MQSSPIEDPHLWCGLFAPKVQTPILPPARSVPARQPGLPMMMRLLDSPLATAMTGPRLGSAAKGSSSMMLGTLETTSLSTAVTI